MPAKQKVLIVDDARDMLDIFSDIITKAGYETRTAQTADAKLAGGNVFTGGSQVLAPSTATNSSLNLAAGVFHEAADRGFQMKLIDIGGGFPAPYDTQVQPFETLARRITAELDPANPVYRYQLSLCDAVHGNWDALLRASEDLAAELGKGWEAHAQYHLALARLAAGQVLLVQMGPVRRVPVLALVVRSDKTVPEFALKL